MGARAVFFDRDGVVNRDSGYVGPIEDFEFLPGVKEALAAIRHQGFLLILRPKNRADPDHGFSTAD